MRDAFIARARLHFRVQQIEGLDRSGALIREQLIGQVLVGLIGCERFNRIIGDRHERPARLRERRFSRLQIKQLLLAIRAPVSGTYERHNRAFGASQSLERLRRARCIDQAHRWCFGTIWQPDRRCLRGRLNCHLGFGGLGVQGIFRWLLPTRSRG